MAKTSIKPKAKQTKGPSAVQVPLWDAFYSWDGFSRELLGKYILGHAGIAASANASKLSSAALYLAVPKKISRKSLKLKSAKPQLVKKSIEYATEGYVVVDDIESPVIQLLQKPNEYQTGKQFLDKIFLQLQHFGDAYILKIRDGVILTSLHALDVAQVQINSKGLEIISYNCNGKAYPPEDIMHISIPHPTRYFYGLGCAEIAWNMLQVSYHKAVSDVARLKNMSRPDIIALFEGASPKQLEQLTTDWETKCRGSKNAGNLLALNAKSATIVPMNPLDEKTIGDSEVVIKTIYAAYRYSYAKFDDTDPSKASAIQAYNGWIDGLSCFAMYVEDAFINDLLPEFPELEKDAILYFEDLRRTDPSLLGSETAQLYKDGIISVAEYKTRFNIPVKPGDEEQYYSQPPKFVINATGENDGREPKPELEE